MAWHMPGPEELHVHCAPVVTVTGEQVLPLHMLGLMQVVAAGHRIGLGTLQLPLELHVPGRICLPPEQLAAGPHDPEVLNAQFPAPDCPAATHWPV